MRRILLIPIAAMLAGCLPAINIPEPYPIKTVTYELNRDTQKWTQQNCTTTAESKGTPIELETVCYKQSIPAPPPGVEKR